MGVSSADKKAFINTIGPMAVKECKERGYGNAQVWTCIAQACDESKYGKANIMKNANAYFGIKATKGWVKKAKYGGLVYNGRTKECYDGKTYTITNACFRAYRCMEDSVSDYFDLLESMSVYRASLTKTTVRDVVTQMQKAPYALSPSYVSTICSFYESDKSLIESYRVDGSVPTVVPETPTTPSYKKGSVYTLQVNLYVRTEPEGIKKLFSELTKDGKLHGYDDGTGALLRKGTRITCQDVRVVHDQTWIKCPSGWLCAVNNIGKIYIK